MINTPKKMHQHEVVSQRTGGIECRACATFTASIPKDGELHSAEELKNHQPLGLDQDVVS